MTITRGGLFSGRQIRSPEASCISSPSLSWISGRQSGPTKWLFLPYQNIEVSGAIPSRSIACPRRNSAASMSWNTPFLWAVAIR